MASLRLGLACYLLCSALVAVSLGAAPPQAGKPGTQQETPRTYAFTFDKAPWPKVLEWLADVTGMPVITLYRPTGTFSFVPQTVDGKPRKYTLDEILDILSDALEGQKYMLVKRHASIGLFPVDDVDELGAGRFATYSIEDLASLPKSQMVRLVFQLRRVRVEDLGPALKQVMGPHSVIVPIEEANQVILIDTAARLRTIPALLNDIDGRRSGRWWTYKCRWANATAVAARLVPLLRERRELILLGVNEAANTIGVSAPPGKMALAKAAVNLLDVPRAPWGRRLGRPLMLKTFTLRTGNATAVAKVLQEIYRGTPSTRITAAGEALLVAYGPAIEMMDIPVLIADRHDWAPSADRILFDPDVDAAFVAKKLTDLVGDPASGGPDIHYDPGVHAIFVKGSPEQILEVKAVIRRLAMPERGWQSVGRRSLSLPAPGRDHEGLRLPRAFFRRALGTW
jgi:type II secretory pathway component GspD/PulD (secretin)